MSGDASGREGFDAFTEDLRVFRHHKVLPLESLLLVLRQCLKDGVFLNEVVEFAELLIEFGFLIDYPLLMRCVCHFRFLGYGSYRPPTANKASLPAGGNVLSKIHVSSRPWQDSAFGGISVSMT
jgi:hypothetical protein